MEGGGGVGKHWGEGKDEAGVGGKVGGGGRKNCEGIGGRIKVVGGWGG